MQRHRKSPKEEYKKILAERPAAAIVIAATNNTNIIYISVNLCSIYRPEPIWLSAMSSGFGNSREFVICILWYKIYCTKWFSHRVTLQRLWCNIILYYVQTNFVFLITNSTEKYDMRQYLNDLKRNIGIIKSHTSAIKCQRQFIV